MNFKELEEKYPVVGDLKAEREILWLNPDCTDFAHAKDKLPLGMADIDDAEARLQRFAPLIMKLFPETEGSKGIIESPLVSIPAMQQALNHKLGSQLKGTLMLKEDSNLPIAGSVKARGGIYEVLKHTEELALEKGLLKEGDSYDKLASPECRKFFTQYKIQVGSTGNLGMSIGIMSAAIGYEAIVHMSADAKDWKKALLRSKGVTVIEYPSDYSEAVVRGRQQSDADPMSYFVDDENSQNLFLGYAVAAKRLIKQLEQQCIHIDGDHPLFVYIPCGVGGAPGGITFGLKEVFGDAVHCFFVEPTQAPCMLAGMATRLHHNISVQDVGLTGQTHADGLAVGRASGFVGPVMAPILSGIFTLRDALLYDYMRMLLETEQVFLEPSACASFAGPARFHQYTAMDGYVSRHGLEKVMDKAVHIAWATGGMLVPAETRKVYEKTHLE